MSTAAPTLARQAIPPFRAVFEQHGRYVFRLLLHLGVPLRHAEDVCQEVFLVVSRRLAECTNPAGLRSWLYAVAWRVASTHRRKPENRREIPSEDAGADLVSADGPTELVEERRRLAQLDRALGTLPDDQRAVFVLYEIEQLTMREVAEVVDCSINTAFSRLYAARRRVASALGITVPQEVWKR